ncbi:MAG: hypothetical protein J6K61_01755 [Clostridia bacterium]|nr:hypothetical protein [Clostridia bacterium]
MKFLKANFHLISRLFVNQMGMTIFGLVLMLAASKINALHVPLSVFSTLFYLYLIHTVMWEEGAKDAIRIEQGRKTKSLFYPWKLSFWASVPNFFIALLMLIGYLFGYLFTTSAAAQQFCTIMGVIASVFEAMYLGIFNGISALLPSDNEALRVAVRVIFYILSSLPMMLASHFSYALGLRNVHFLIPRYKKGKKE